MAISAYLIIFERSGKTMDIPVHVYCDSPELMQTLEFVLSNISDGANKYHLNIVDPGNGRSLPEFPPIFFLKKMNGPLFDKKDPVFQKYQHTPCLIFIQSNPHPAAEFTILNNLPWIVQPFELRDSMSISLLIRFYLNSEKNMIPPALDSGNDEIYQLDKLHDDITEMLDNKNEDEIFEALITMDPELYFFAVIRYRSSDLANSLSVKIKSNQPLSDENQLADDVKNHCFSTIAKNSKKDVVKDRILLNGTHYYMIRRKLSASAGDRQKILAGVFKTNNSRAQARFNIICKSYQTQLQKALYQKKLSEEMNNYSHLLDISSVGIWEDDRQGKLTYCNEFIPAIFGYEKKQMIGRSFASFIEKKDIEMVKTLHRFRIEGKTALDHYQVTGKRKDGRTIYLDIAVNPIFDGENIVGTRAFIWDVTEKQKIKKALKRREKILEAVRFAAETLLDQDKSDEDFSLILEHLGTSAEVQSVMLFSLEHEDNTAVGKRMYDWYAKKRSGEFAQLRSNLKEMQFAEKGLSRWPKSFAQGHSIYARTNDLPPAEKQYFSQLGVQSLIASPVMVNRESWGYILLLSLKNEQRDWSEGEVASIKAAAGVFASKIQSRDIRRDLLDSEHRYRLVAETLPDSIYIIARQKILWANHRGVLLLGAKRLSKIYDLPIVNFISPQEMTRFRAFVKSFSQNDDKIRKVRLKIHRLDGKKIDIEATARMNDILGENAILAIVRDITAEKQSEKELFQLAQVVRQATESIVITDTDGNIEYVNPAYEKITGYTFKEVLGKKNSILKSGQHSDAFYANLWKTILKGDFWRDTFINKAKDGTIYYEQAVIFPIKSKRGKIINFASVKRDITRERLLEIRVNRTERLEAVGKLAGGISHDFNNIITAIYGFISIAKEHDDDPQVITEAIGGVERSAQRAAGLVKQLLAFSRRQLIEPEIIQPNKLISDFSNMLERLIGEDIKLAMDLAPDVRNIFADSGQLEQVLMNLVVNARDALQSRKNQVRPKEIKISTKNHLFKKKKYIESFEIFPGHYLELKVSDNGAGMDEGIKSHIFEPFFTTKSMESGTGLGLATVYGVVKQNNGFITVKSEPELGSEFSVLWPAHLTEKELTQLETPVESVTKGGTERILFVEDDLQIREFAEIFLKKLGYDVILAGDGREALKKFKRLKKPIDLLLTDLVMPNLGGSELAEKISQLNKNVKVIFSSGYLNKLFQDKDQLKKMNTISKPYKIHDLARLIRKVLDN